MYKRTSGFILLLLAAVMLFLTGCQDTSEGQPATGNETVTETTEKDTDSIVILHTNDVHCALADNIGYDGLYLYKEELMQDYEHVLLVDAGDAVQGGTYGSLSKGELIIDLMNDVGYDVAILGNHEFDYGFETLDDLSEKLNCGYICANFCTADGETVFESYRIVEAAGKKIAFISVDTPETFTKSTIHSIVDDAGIPMYDFLADATGERLTECLQKNVDEVRAKGADIVILLAHLGNGENDELRFHSEELIAKTTGIDLLIDGHEHAKITQTMTNKDGEPVPAAQTGTKLEAIGKVVIHPDNTITAELVEEVPEPDGIDAEKVQRGKKERWVDSGMKQKIEDYCASYQSLLNRKIGESECDLPVKSENMESLAKRGETGMLNLLTDIMRERFETDIALYVGGGARGGLKKGDILFSDCVSAFPYGNDVLVVKLKGKYILEALEFGARRLPEENNGFMHVSGMEYIVNLTVPSAAEEDARGVFVRCEGPYRVTDVLVNGEPLDPEKDYIIAMNNYLQGRGDGMEMMKNAEVLRYTGMVEYELLADFIETELHGVVPEHYQTPEGRIKQIAADQ